MNSGETNLGLHLQQHLLLILHVKLLFHSQNLPAAVVSAFCMNKLLWQAKAEHCDKQIKKQIRGDSQIS